MAPGRLPPQEVEESSVETILQARSKGQWKAPVRHLRSVAPPEQPSFEARRDVYRSTEEWVRCPLCSKTFADMQACISHGARAHGLKNERRNYVVSTHCACCMKEFWTRERALHHLKRAERCWRLVQHGLVPLEGQEVDRLDREQAHVQRENKAKACHTALPA